MLIAAPVAGQQTTGIQWRLDVPQAVEEARRSRLPMMFWVVGRSGSRDKDLERDQKRAFRDSLVAELASRFVTVQLSRSRYSEQLEEWSLSRRANLEIVFSTPDGDKIDTLAPLGVADAETLARKMALVFRHYRQQIYERELKPNLEDAEATDQELRAALRLIAKLLILSADEAVIGLLERKSLSAERRRQVYETLAVLSTRLGVAALLERAVGDEAAAAALTGCTPDGAEQMLSALKVEDFAQRLIVYRAVTRICRISNVKPDRFWGGRYETVKLKEIQRVSDIVTRAAERWRQRYAEYR
jgi:hypothetical protein